MRPKEVHHTVTNLHRQPGGLASLDFLINKLQSLQQSINADEYRVALLGDQNSAYAIPLALSGFEIVSFHISETDLHKADDLAEEIGVPVINKLGIIADNAGNFDAIIDLKQNREVGDLAEEAKVMVAKLKPGGRLFFAMAKKGIDKKVRSYKNIVQNLVQANLFIADCHPTSLLLKSFYDSSYRHKLKSNLERFHLLDHVDRCLSGFLPTPLSSGWIFECLVKQSDQPLVIQLLPTLSAGGGAERLAVQLAEMIPKHGFSSCVISIVTGGKLESILQTKQIPYLIIERSGKLARLTNLIRLTRIFKDNKPAIVHTHLFAPDLWGRIAARLAGVPLVITTIHNVKTRFKKIGELVMQAMAGFSHVYIAISIDVQQYLTQSIRINPKKIKTIVNGIDLNLLHKRDNRPFRDVPKLIFVGRLEEQKAPLTLIHALKDVPGPWELSIFGSGSLETEMRRLAEDLNLMSRIRFMGVSNDLYSQYANYDLFILPSLWEGFGLAAIEAAAANLSMIVSDLPVMHELFTEKEVAFAPPGDAEGLAKVIHNVLTNPAQAASMSRELASRDFTPYSISRMVKEYADVYKY